MRKLFLVSLLSAVSVPAMASCDALKDQIDAKLQAKGVKSYTLEIQPVQAAARTAPAASPQAAASGVPAASAVPAATAAANKGKVVGTCDGGTKQIIYTRG